MIGVDVVGVDIICHQNDSRVVVGFDVGIAILGQVVGPQTHLSCGGVVRFDRAVLLREHEVVVGMETHHVGGELSDGNGM